MVEEKLFAVVTKTTIASKPMNLSEAEKHKEKMLKKVGKTSKIKNTVRKLLPKDMRVVDIDEVVKERQKALESSIEILPFDSESEKFLVITNSTLVSRGRYNRDRAEHLQGMIEKTYRKVSAGKIVTVEVVEAE